MSGLFGVLSNNSRASLVKFMTQVVKVFLVFYGRFIIVGTKARNSSVS